MTHPAPNPFGPNPYPPPPRRRGIPGWVLAPVAAVALAAGAIVGAGGHTIACNEFVDSADDIVISSGEAFGAVGDFVDPDASIGQMASATQEFLRTSDAYMAAVDDYEDTRDRCTWGLK